MPYIFFTELEEKYVHFFFAMEIFQKGGGNALEVEGNILVVDKQEEIEVSRIKLVTPRYWTCYFMILSRTQAICHG